MICELYGHLVAAAGIAGSTAIFRCLYVVGILQFEHVC